LGDVGGRGGERCRDMSSGVTDQIKNLLIMQVSCHPLPLEPKYLSQQPILPSTNTATKRKVRAVMAKFNGKFTLYLQTKCSIISTTLLMEVWA